MSIFSNSVVSQVATSLIKGPRTTQSHTLYISPPTMFEYPAFKMAEEIISHSAFHSSLLILLPCRLLAYCSDQWNNTTEIQFCSQNMGEAFYERLRSRWPEIATGRSPVQVLSRVRMSSYDGSSFLPHFNFPQFYFSRQFECSDE